MVSKYKKVGYIDIPNYDGHVSMIPFDLETLVGLPDEFSGIVKEMLSGIKAKGEAYFTIHGETLKKSQTLRRPGPHTDGSYDLSVMSWGNGGGGGWKVNDCTKISKKDHDRLYNSETGGIILASNYSSCIGWEGEFDNLPGHGGDCSHFGLDYTKAVVLQPNTVYYGNNHFIHESLPVADDIHRVLCRITLPEDHNYN